ncbi:MAG: inorganic phosphate transporter, PiT family [Gaiellales bacterium]|jgi:PiT family inorganic phosphate transporter|nr:inorganic phosphate transporter, PiT family [Gaiellales bacterium]
MSDVLVWVVVATALGFDFTNGFHDTANAVATTVSTRALSPRVAVAIAASMNLLGALVWTAVAKNVASGLIDADLATQRLLLAALIGAIAWNLVTWYLGLPSSSSHALVGGLVGAALAANGSKGVQWDGIWNKVAIPALESPVIGFFIAGGVILVIMWGLRRSRPAPLNRGFRYAQIASGSLMAFLHGTNDAQKTMGVITLALVTNGTISGTPDNFDIPWEVKVAAGVALAMGTYVGGWRIMRTMGSRIFKITPAQGFAAQTTASLVLWYTARAGFPISTTQVISGSVLGVGAATNPSAVRWGIAANILLAWALTLPAAAAAAALVYFVIGPVT